MDYKLDDTDIRTLREAKQRIMIVYNYHYGAPGAKRIVNRIETILDKLDFLIASGDKK